MTATSIEHEALSSLGRSTPRSEARSDVPESLSLEAVLRELAERKICCGILTTARNTVLVWLARDGEVIEGAEHMMPLSSNMPDLIARWLKDTADRLYGPAPPGPARRSRRPR
jgi:hypothetical protein